MPHLLFSTGGQIGLTKGTVGGGVDVGVGSVDSSISSFSLIKAAILFL
jgi:hypothetical protein